MAAGWPGFTYFQFHNFIERYHHLLIAPALKKKEVPGRLTGLPWKLPSLNQLLRLWRECSLTVLTEVLSPPQYWQWSWSAPEQGNGFDIRWWGERMLDRCFTSSYTDVCSRRVLVYFLISPSILPNPISFVIQEIFLLWVHPWVSASKPFPSIFSLWVNILKTF